MSSDEETPESREEVEQQEKARKFLLLALSFQDQGLLVHNICLTEVREAADKPLMFFICFQKFMHASVFLLKEVSRTIERALDIYISTSLCSALRLPGATAKDDEKTPEASERHESGELCKGPLEERKSVEPI